LASRKLSRLELDGIEKSAFIPVVYILLLLIM